MASGLIPFPRTVELFRILNRRLAGFHFPVVGWSSARRAVKPTTQVILIPRVRDLSRVEYINGDRQFQGYGARCLPAHMPSQRQNDA